MASDKLTRKRQRKQRRKKLRHLRERIAETRSASERQRLTEKIRRISPGALTPDQ